MKKPIYLIVLASLILTAGCASYRATSLNSLPSQDVASYAGSESDLFVAAKAFDKSDCRKYLDRDVIAQGYQPVQLYIKNDSDKNYLFSLNRINLSCAHSEQVAKTVHTSTVGRAVGYGAGAVFLCPLLAIPAVVDGMKSAEANDALDADFSAKTARDQVIAAHSNFNKLLFVPLSEYQTPFTITLVEQGTERVKTLHVVVY